MTGIALAARAAALACAVLPLPLAGAGAAGDVVAEAKAAVTKFAGPQTAWEGPTTGPKAEPGKKIVYVSGDENNDICRLYGVFQKEAGQQIGWDVTIIDGKGTPTGWIEGVNQALALKPNGVSMCADAASLQEPMRTGAAQGVVFVGLHAAADPGPHPDIHLFANVSQDPVAIGKATADWPIADSGGKARVVVITHNEYAIANRKSTATKEQIEACPGCKMLEVANFPASAASDRMPALITSWVQRYGVPLYVTSVGDNDFDFAVPSLRGGGVSPDDVKLIGADGNRSAYQRIRAGGQYQVVTISEPFEQQAYQAIDEFNRAFHGEKWSGFVQQPFLVTAANVNAEGGEKDMFFPGNGYREHYLKIWGVAGK
jgi:ribose transport system substrate-binding protein